MFQINDKVVCVDARNTGDPTLAMPLKEGVVYVVRGVDTDFPDGAVGLFVVGACAGYWGRQGEVPFDSKRFRKLSDVQAENAAKRAGALNA